MKGILIIGRCKPIIGVPGKLQTVLNGKLRIVGVKIHYPAHSIGAVDNRSWSKNYFRTLNGKGIYGDDVLYISTPEYGIVHTHPIYGNLDPICSKSPDHGTS